jgi:hypothetical protein
MPIFLHQDFYPQNDAVKLPIAGTGIFSKGGLVEDETWFAYHLKIF